LNSPKGSNCRNINAGRHLRLRHYSFNLPCNNLTLENVVGFVVNYY